MNALINHLAINSGVAEPKIREILVANWVDMRSIIKAINLQSDRPGLTFDLTARFASGLAGHVNEYRASLHLPPLE